METAKKSLKFYFFLPEKILEKFLELKCNSVSKGDFETMTLNDFWARYVHVYKNIGTVAMGILLPFSATYMYESSSSKLVSLKTKARNKRDCVFKIIKHRQSSSFMFYLRKITYISTIY